jgi:hypothetical protein
MGILDRLFGRKAATTTVSSQDLITEACEGQNLVDGKPAWAFAKEKKDDLEYMMRCAEAELTVMERAKTAAAPYYFERVAILLRKNKRYADEVRVCERYIAAVDNFYEDQDLSAIADIRRGPRFQAIVKRLPKARSLNDIFSNS